MIGTRLRALTLSLVVATMALATVGERDAHAKAYDLDYRLELDVSIAAGGLLVWIETQVGAAALAPAACRFCASNPFDEGVRSALVWKSTDGAEALSNALAYAAAPIAAIALDLAAAGHEGALRDAPIDLVLLAELASLSMGVNQAVKFTVARERPFVHQLSLADKARTGTPSDNNTSFFSGHTTFVTALAVGLGTIAELRGYRLAPLVWVVGIAISLATGYARIAADKHWATDVMVGAVVGAGVGAGVPLLAHRRKTPANGVDVGIVPSAVPNGDGAGLALRVTF